MGIGVQLRCPTQYQDNHRKKDPQTEQARQEKGDATSSELFVVLIVGARTRLTLMAQVQRNQY